MMRGSAGQIAERSALSEFLIGKGAASACPFHRFNHRVAEEVKGAWGAGRQAFRRIAPLPDQHKRDACAKDDAIAPPQLSAGDFRTGADLASGASVPSRPAEVSGAIYLAAMRAKISDLNRQALSAELPSCGPALVTEPAPPPRPERHYEPAISEPWIPGAAIPSPRPEEAIPSSGEKSIAGSKIPPHPAPALHAPPEPAPPAPKPRQPALSEPAGIINCYAYDEIPSSPWPRRLYGHLMGMADAEALPMAGARIGELPSQRQHAATLKGPEPPLRPRQSIRIARPKQTMPPTAPAKRAPERAIRPQKTRKEAPGGAIHPRKDAMKRKPASAPAHAHARENRTKDKGNAPAKAGKLLKTRAPRQGSAEKPKAGPAIMKEELALLKKRRRAAASLLRNGEKPAKSRPSPVSGKKKIKNIRTPSQAPSGAP